ncbi:MAG: DUF3352 domain-containing protein [Candidatus Melainabacteria bacterium]
MAQSDFKSQRNLAIVMVVLALSVLGWVIIGQQPGTTSRLAAYYPQATSIYAEIQTNPQRGRRLLAVLEDALLSPAKPDTKNNKDTAVEPAGDIEKALVAHFAQTFEPQISLGTWMPTDHGQMTDPRMDALMALPLRKPQTLGNLLTQLDLPADAFATATLKNIPYAIHHETQVALAVVHNVLLVANTVDTLIATIEQLPGNVMREGPDPRTSLLKRPATQRYISLLPRGKDGFFIVDHAALHRELKASRPSGGSPSETSGATGSLLVRILPVTVGAVHLDNNAPRVDLETFTPLVLKNLNNTRVIAPLRRLFNTAQPIHAPQMLPESTAFLIATTTADQVYDLLTSRVLSKNNLNQIHSAEKFLSMFNLKLREDVVGLMAGEVALAAPSATEKNVIPTILMAQTQDKVKTMTRVTNILGSGLIPVKRKSEQIQNIPVDTFSLPGKPLQLTTGNLGRMIAISTGANFTDLITTTQHPEQSLAHQALIQELAKRTPPKQLMMIYSTMDTRDDTLRKQLNASHQAAAAARLTQSGWLEGMAGALWARRVSDKEDLLLGRLLLQLKTPDSDATPPVAVR